MVNIAIFASGNGSNTENIINYFRFNIHINVVLVISNNKNAFVLERAKNNKIHTLVLSKSDLLIQDITKPIFSKFNIDFIVLAGFMIKLPDYIIKLFPDKILNIHPALLPKYGGKGMYGDFVHKAVIAAEEMESGISIHYVNERYDEGQIIFQAKCPVMKIDTPESLQQRVHELEYEYYPAIIEKVIKKTFYLSGL